VSDKSIEALGALSKALETTERARGVLYEFHQLTGSADLGLDVAVGLLREAGHGEQADLVEQEIVGRNVIAIRATADDREARVRARVAICLDRFPLPQTGPDPGTVTVLERLGEAPDAYVREEALAALQRLRGADID
jgi:hypothetical protein